MKRIKFSDRLTALHIFTIFLPRHSVVGTVKALADSDELIIDRVCSLDAPGTNFSVVDNGRI